MNETLAKAHISVSKRVEEAAIYQLTMQNKILDRFHLLVDQKDVTVTVNAC